jgi:hypothetical protein
VSKIDLVFTLSLLIFYAIGCFFLGWAWYHYGWMAEEQEVNNNYNKFVKEMRKNVVRKKRKI